MNLSFFGREIFNFSKSKGDQLLGMAMHSDSYVSKYIPDFYKVGNNFNGNPWSDFAAMEITSGNIIGKSPTSKKGAKAKKVAVKKVAVKKAVTPKGVYDLELLHDKTFKMNTDAEYVDGQLSDFKDKLSMISSEEYDMRRGLEEIGSMVMRLENRKKYAEVKDAFEEFPYTTSTKIQEVLKNHDNLKIGQVAQFLADMPKEAVDAMKRYNAATKLLCEKQAVFYIIADKKDFEKTNTRRDPILLAQSPFGHFWQILGAWDDEMLFLEEL